MVRRALITGINGFTGPYLECELARQGWDVWGLDMQEALHRPKYLQVNLQDRYSLVCSIERIKPNVVVHLAGITHVEHTDVRAFYDVNVVGTRTLLEVLASQRSSINRVLLASSANVYGNSKEGQLDEKSPTIPANDYAVSKLAMEHMAWLWADKLPITIARPFNYTGVGQSQEFLLPKIVSHFRKKAHSIELGNLDVRRDFSDVRDVVVAYRKLLEEDAAINETVNVCTGQLVSLQDVLDEMERIAGRPITAIVNPHLVRANEVQTLYGDTSKLRSILGAWKPRPLEDTLNWMLTDESECAA